MEWAGLETKPNMRESRQTVELYLISACYSFFSTEVEVEVSSAVEGESSDVVRCWETKPNMRESRQTVEPQLISAPAPPPLFILN